MVMLTAGYELNNCFVYTVNTYAQSDFCFQYLHINILCLTSSHPFFFSFQALSATDIFFKPVHSLVHMNWKPCFP